MKILLVHRYFWPDHPNCGQILWHLAKHLSSLGHTIDIITSLPSKDLNSRKINSKKIENIDNIKIKRLDLIIEGQNPFKKIINAFSLGLWTNFYAIRNNYDLIISTTIPPIAGGFFGALAACITKARFIYFCMDLHPEVGRISKDFSNPIIYSILKKIDNWSCKKANPVVVHSIDMKNSLNLRNKDEEFEIDIINNFSIPAEQFDNSIPHINLEKKDKKLIIIFAGNVGRFQKLEAVIDAMIILQDRKDIELTIVGDGSAKPELVSKIKKSNANVNFFDQQPIHVVKEMIKKSDIGLVSLRSETYKYGYPGKIMSYLEQGKPIIAVLERESEIVKLMEKENCGFCISSFEPKKISQLLLKLADDDTWKSKMNFNAFNAYEKYFSRNKILSKWSDILSFK